MDFFRALIFDEIFVLKIPKKSLVVLYFCKNKSNFVYPGWKILNPTEYIEAALDENSNSIGLPRSPSQDNK